MLLSTSSGRTGVPTRRKPPLPPVQQLLDEDIEERFVKVSSALCPNAPHSIPLRMPHPKRYVEGRPLGLEPVPFSGIGYVSPRTAATAVLWIDVVFSQYTATGYGTSRYIAVYAGAK